MFSHAGKYAWVLICALWLVGCGGSGDLKICSGNIELSCSLGLTDKNIEVDPFNAAPLSAQLSFVTPVSGTVRVTVKGKGTDGVDISHNFAQSDNSFMLPVFGLYPGYENSVVVEFTADSGDTTRDLIAVSTDPLLGPVVEILQDNLPDNSTGLYLFSSQKAAFDRQGEIRWAYTGEATNYYEQLASGRWIGTINANSIGYHYPKFAEFTMLGEKLAEYSSPNYFHHEVTKLPSGNYLAASNSTLIDFATNGVPEEDVLLEISAVTGSILRSWDFNLILDPGRPPIPSNGRPDDWLHMNSAAYDPTDDSIIITSQRQSLAAKIDYSTGALKWILGAHEQWGAQFQDKLLTPVDANGDPLDPNSTDFWPYGPHAAVALGNGSISLYDNGSFRGWYADNSVPGSSYSRGVEYWIDEVNMTVRIAWLYDANESLFTPSTGDIDLLEDGNYLIGFAGQSDDTPRVVEITPSSDILFEAVADRGGFQYRAEKIDLYAGY